MALEEDRSAGGGMLTRRRNARASAAAADGDGDINAEWELVLNGRARKSF